MPSEVRPTRVTTSGWGGSQGMTLIEVIMAMAIFTMAVVWTVSSLMSAIAANRITTARITANGAILDKREEVQMVARGLYGNASTANLPDAVIKFYGDTLANNNSGSVVGPNGKLWKAVEAARQNLPRKPGDAGTGAVVGILHWFAVPGPSESVTDSDDPNTVYQRGYGQMVVYLDEESVPTGGPEDKFWADLGNNAKEGEGETEPGFDMNGDGEISRGGVRVNGAVLNPDAIIRDPVAAKVKNLPIDITIRYYRDPALTREYYETTRRVMITGIGDTGAIQETFK